MILLGLFLKRHSLAGTQPWAAPLLLRYTRFIVGCELMFLQPVMLHLTPFDLAAEGPFKLAEMTTKCVKNRIAQMEQAQASGEEVRRDML